MKILPAFSVAALVLALAACGGESDKSAARAAPIAAVAPPAGTIWSETIAQTADGHYVMGNPDAKVKLVEYGSYTCSHCADFAKEADPEIRKIVDTGKMSFEFRNYIRDPMDMASALLARCGGKDIFYPLSEQFFGNQGAMFEKAQAMGDAAYQAAMSAPPAERFGRLASAVGLLDFAKQRGIAEDQAKQCLGDTAAAEALAKGVEKANADYQITGTPSFILNGALIDNVANWAALQPKLKDAGI
jgi:protein-disulfide isomerase